MSQRLLQQIRSEIEGLSDEEKLKYLNELRTALYELSPEKVNPVDRVLWVPKEKVRANDYNPNSVASKEMKLLHISVKEDGYTMPIVTVYDKDTDQYVIVDGFHRNLVLRTYKDIHDRCMGHLPIVVIDKDIDQRMASTVRHNRARGTHSVDGMSNIIYEMMRDGKSEREICEKLGLELKEFTKLKYITGFAKVFKNYDYSKAIDAIVDVHKIAKESETKDE